MNHGFEAMLVTWLTNSVTINKGRIEFGESHWCHVFASCFSKAMSSSAAVVVEAVGVGAVSAGICIVGVDVSVAVAVSAVGLLLLKLV